MGLYEIGLIGGALFGAMGLLSLISMFSEAGSWRVFFGFAIITGLFGGLAHLNSDTGIDPADVVPAIAKAVEMFGGSAE